MKELLELMKKERAGEIAKAEWADETNVVLMRARVSLTDEEFRDILCALLAVHHELAKDLSGHGYDIAGNDPFKPN